MAENQRWPQVGWVLQEDLGVLVAKSDLLVRLRASGCYRHYYRRVIQFVRGNGPALQGLLLFASSLLLSSSALSY